MKNFEDLNWKPFTEYESEIKDKYSIYEYFFPKLRKSLCAKSNNGYLLYTYCLNWKRIQIIGDVNIDDLDLDGSFVFYVENKNNNDYKSYDNNMLDFIVELSDKELKKYKQKNSIDRKIKDYNIIIKHNPFICKNEFDELFNKWSIQTKSNRYKKNHSDFLKNENLDKIGYYINNQLVGLQIFEKSCNNIYWLINMCDYDSMKSSSPLLWTYPQEYYKQKIHFGGAGPNDDRLIEHKNRICNGKFVSFSKSVIQKIGVITEEKRKQQFENLLNMYYNNKS